MVSIKFPDTDVVTCVFSLKNSTTSYNQKFLPDVDVVPETEMCKLKKYYYRVPKFLQSQLRPGDFVVVHCQTGYQVCQVRGVNESCVTESDKLAPVVAKVNLDEYFVDLEHQEELKRMKSALIKERKRLEEQVTWDLIASKSPEFATLLQAFRDAGGEL